MAVQMGRYRLTIGDESYEFQPDAMLGSDLFLMERATGGSFAKWLHDVNEYRHVACQFLWWYVRKEAGITEDRGALDRPWTQLIMEPVAEDEGDPKGNAASEKSGSNGTKPSKRGSVSAGATGKT